MPTVPQYDQRQETAGLPALRATATATPEDFGAASARGLQAVGGELARSSQIVAENAFRWQERQDAEAVQRAFIDYDNRLRAYQTAPETGVYNRRGRAAVGASVEATKTLEDFEREIGEGLTDRQRQQFTREAARVKGGILDNVARHEAREFQVAEAETAKAFLQGSLDSAVANYRDPALGAAYLGKAEGEIRRQAALNGLPAEVAEQRVAQHRGLHHTAIIDRMLTEDPDGARAYYAQQQGQIPGSDRAAIERQFARLEEERRRDAEIAANRARIEQEAALREAERELRGVEQVLEHNAQVRPDLLERVRHRVAGTELEPVLDGMLAGYADRAGFGTQPVTQQAAELERRRAALEDPAVGGDQATVADFAARARIHKVALQDIETDALSAAASRGLVQLTPLDQSSPDALAASLRARVTQASAAGAWAGRAVAPLTTGEVEAFGRVLDTAAPERQKQLLAALADGIADREQYRALLTGMSKERPLLAVAGLAAARGPDDLSADPAGRDVAGLVLTGSHALRTKAIAIGDTGNNEARNFRLQFDEYLADAGADNLDARNVTYEAARAIYAGLTLQAGELAERDLNDDRVRTAIELAVGGRAVEYGDRSVIAPAAFADDFEDRVHAALRRLEEFQVLPPGVTADDLLDMPLSSVGVGKYLVRSGTGFVTDHKGDPLVVDLSKSR